MKKEIGITHSNEEKSNNSAAGAVQSPVSLLMFQLSSVKDATCNSQSAEAYTIGFLNSYFSFFFEVITVLHW